MVTNHKLPWDSQPVKFHAQMQGKEYQCLDASRPHCAQMLTFSFVLQGMPQTLKSELALLLKPQWCMQPTLTWFFVSSGRCGIPKWYVQLREPTAHGTHTPFTHFLLIVHRVKPPESRCFWLLCMLRLCSHSNIWKCPLASQSIFKMLLVLWNFWKHLCH